MPSAGRDRLGYVRGLAPFGLVFCVALLACTPSAFGVPGAFLGHLGDGLRGFTRRRLCLASVPSLGVRRSRERW